MKTVKSKDGTTIAYEQLGSGPPLLLVDGAFCMRAFGPMPKLAPLLAEHFTVVHYDRRGRGDSTDTQPFAAEREIEDLRAVVEAVGGTPFVYGTSSGAMLALRAVAAGVPAKALVMYEPPLALDGTHYPKPADFREQVGALLKADDRSAAVKLFMRVVGMPSFAIVMMSVMMRGVWSQLKGVAHTLPYDFAQLGDTQTGGPMPDELAQVCARINVPTLLGAGSKSPAWMHHAGKALAGKIAGAKTTIVAGQDHNASEKAIAPLLIDFFGATRSEAKAA